MQLTKQEILEKLKEVLLIVDDSKADVIRAATEETRLAEDLGLTSVGSSPLRRSSGSFSTISAWTISPPSATSFGTSGKNCNGLRRPSAEEGRYRSCTTGTNLSLRYLRLRQRSRAVRFAAHDEADGGRITRPKDRLADFCLRTDDIGGGL